MLFAEAKDRIRSWIRRLIKWLTKPEYPTEAPEPIPSNEARPETTHILASPPTTASPKSEPASPSDPGEGTDAEPKTTDDSASKEEPKKEPRKIGPRRIKPDNNRQKPNRPAQLTRPFTPRAELLCRQARGSSWELILSVPEECGIVKIQHDNNPLSVDENGECRPSSFSGTLKVEYSDGKTDEIIPLVCDKTPLVFKMRNGWQGSGRKISGITRGHFIVFTPAEWKRTGRVPVEAENCVDADFRAHYFHARKNDANDEIGGFKEYEVPLTPTGFELEGTRIFDDSEDGELFVDTVPRVKPASGIVWARVGEERQRGWSGENFRPDDKSLKKVLNGRQRRFYVRVYDDAPKLMDSGEFRYYADLQDIQVNGVSYSQDMLLLPTSDGHSPTRLQFIARNGELISQDRLELKGNNPHAAITPDGVLTIAPHPDGDEITLVLKANTSSVAVKLHLPRVWWRLERSGEEPSRWGDQPLNMTRDEFRDRANKSTVIKLRLPSRIKSADVGFGDNLDRRLPIGDGLPLGNFIDYTEIDNPSSEEVELRIRCNSERLTLIQLAADLPAPTKKPLTNNMPDTCPSGNKGFSCGELRKANLTAADAKRLQLRIDRRRRSEHNSNIDRLMEIGNDA